MTDNNPLVNIGELSKPATVLIEKISDAIGSIFKPWQIRRVAQAEGEAEKIEAVAQIKISQLQRRALQRFVTEEAKKQSNKVAFFFSDFGIRCALVRMSFIK